MNRRLFIRIGALIWALVLAVGITRAVVRWSEYGGVPAITQTEPESAALTKFEHVYRTMLSEYYTELEPEALIEGAISGMLDSVNDPYTFYYTAEEWATMLSDSQGAYAGIGVQVLDGDGLDSLLITRCFKGSPAEEAGLRAGDRIVSVDGYSVALALSGGDVPEGSPANRTELMKYMRGEEGSQVTLTVERDGARFDAVLTRAVISMNRVEYCMLSGDARVGYMAIYEFQGDAAQGVREALDYFEKQDAQGLVVDLRNNPGGDLNVITQVADAMLPEGLYAYIEDRSGSRQEFHSDAKCWGKPMAVLVNGYSASASELFTGAAKDMGAAVIVGGNTFGKGVVQGVIGLQGGAGFQLTTARYFTPSGHVIQGNGIAPDIAVELGDGCDSSLLTGLVSGGSDEWRSCDAQLLAAYEAVTGLINSAE